MQLVPLRLKAPKPKETDFEPRTLGEHIRKRRLILKISKGEAGGRLGVTPETLQHWEKDQTQPSIACIPAVLGFLGYDPFPEPRSIPDQLLAKCRTRG